MEARLFVLRRLVRFAEHFARPGEVETAFWRQVLHCGQQVVRAVDVGVERRELVVKRVADEALGGQVIALIRLYLCDHLVNTGIAFE